MASKDEKDSQTELDLKAGLDLTTEEWERFKAVEEKQKTFQIWLRKKAVRRDGETETLELKSYKEFAKHWSSLAGGARSEVETKRQRGWRKWSQRFGTFANGADRFMKDFNGMIQFAKVAGSPYSGPAIATVAALFAIARNKHDLDDEISSAILDVKDRLPGFELYEQIYDDKNEERDERREQKVKELKKKIVFAYVGFIDLAIQATKYYMKGGMRRWLIAFWNPESFHRLSDDVQTAVSAVRLKCDELLALTVHDIRQQNLKLVKKVSKLESDNEENNFIVIEKLLGLKDWSVCIHRKRLEKYKARLWEDRKEDGYFSQKYGGTEPDYGPGPSFLEWKSSPTSSILVLVGVNDELVEQGRRTCWLSVQAFNFMDQLHSTSSLHASYAFSIWKRASLFSAISKLLLQLLRARQKDVRGQNFFANLRAHLHEYADLPDREREEKKVKLKEAALKTVELFKPDETVYIVIDRIDQCEEQDQVDLVKILLEMSESCRCVLKVLAVAKKLGWRVNEWELGTAHRSRFKQVVGKQDLQKGNKYFHSSGSS